MKQPHPYEQEDPFDEADADLHEAERLLEALPLREPSAQLDIRVRRLTHRARWLERARIAGMGLAAVLAISIGVAPWWHSRVKAVAPPERSTDKPNAIVAVAEPTAPAQRSPVRPLLFQRTTAQVSDDGVVAFVGGTPVQRVRRHSVQKVLMVDPRTGAQAIITIPRDEIVLKKVQSF